MKSNGDIRVSRVNINLESECKDWYKKKALTMGMQMSNLLSFVVANYYEQQRNAETLRNISDFNQNEDLKQLSADVRELLTAVSNFSFTAEKTVEDTSEN